MGERRILYTLATYIALTACSGDPSGSGQRLGQSDAAGQAGANGSPVSIPDSLDTNGAGPVAGPEAVAAPPPVQLGGAKPGTFVPSAVLDPDVQFDWPEAQEGRKCEAGTYTGSFECTFGVDPTQAAMFPFGPMEIPPVTGPVAFTFERSEHGEFLELTNATLVGTAMDYIGFNAVLSGRLDCATMELTAELISGEAGFGQPIVLQFVELSGGLSGTLDGQTGVLTGTWSIGDASFGECEGPWTATFTP
jgi:hypothetical protein